MVGNFPLILANMTLVYILLLVIIVLLISLIVKIFFGTTAELPTAVSKLTGITSEIQRVESSVKLEIASNLKEFFEQGIEARKEIQLTLRSFEERLDHL